MTTEEKQKQVADQCRALAFLASAVAQVYGNYATLTLPEGILDMVGRRTACLMEVLGEHLNGIDAVVPADRWVDPIFAKAQDLYPSCEAK